MAYTAITRAQLRTRLQARYDDTPFWTDAEANEAINEGLLTWGLLTGRWRSTVVLSTTANTPEYAIPAGLTYRARVAFNNLSMSPASLVEMNLGRPHWWSETTTSGGAVPTRPTLWVPLSLALIAIWPADATGNNALTVEGVANTPILTADGAFVDLSEADLSVQLGFDLHVLLFKKGGPAFQKSMADFTAFLSAAAEENDLVKSSQFYRQWMGLDRRDLKILKGVPSRVASLAQGNTQ